MAISPEELEAFERALQGNESNTTYTGQERQRYESRPAQAPPQDEQAAFERAFQEQSQGIQPDESPTAPASQRVETEQREPEEDDGFFDTLFAPQRRLGETLARLSSDVKEAEQSRDQLKSMLKRAREAGLDDRSEAIIANIGSGIDNIFEDVPTARSATEISADVINTALWIVPFGNIGRAASVAKTGAGVAGGASSGVAARLGNIAFGQAGKQSFKEIGVRGAVTGGLFEGSGSIGAGDDVGTFMKRTLVGVAAGAPLEVGGVLAARGAKIGTSFLVDKAKKPFIGTWTKYGPSFFRSLGNRLENDFGAAGREAAETLNALSESSRRKAGTRQAALMEAGVEEAAADPARNKKLLAALEGTGPVTDDIRDAYNATNKVRQEIAKEAEDLGLEVVDPVTNKKRGFEARENFFPHSRPAVHKLKRGPLRNEVVENSVDQGSFASREEAEGALDDLVSFLEEGKADADNKFVKWLIETEQASDVDEALGMLTRDLDNTLGRKRRQVGSLEFPRVFDNPFWDPNVYRSMSNYQVRATTRLEETRLFGQDLEKEVNKIVGQVRQQFTGAPRFEKAREFDKLIRRAMGLVQFGNTEEQVSRMARLIQIPKLAFAQIPNASQSVNTLLATDVTSFVQGSMYAFRKEGVQRALQSGATLDQAMREAHRLAGAGGDFGEWFLKWTGFSFVERMNRGIAANVGSTYAENTFKKLLRNPTDEVLQSRLTELGIDPAAAISRGALTEDELLSGALRIADQTQFATRPTDLPFFVSSPMGKMIAQYKSFAFQQSKFLANQFKKRVKAGDTAGVVRDLFILSTVYPMAGEVVGDIRSVIANTERPTNLFERYLENIMNVGGLGIMADAMSSANYGRLADWMIGPSAGTATDLIQRSIQVPKKGGFTDSDLRFLFNQPGVTRSLSGYLFPRDRKGQETFINSLQTEFQEFNF